MDDGELGEMILALLSEEKRSTGAAKEHWGINGVGGGTGHTWYWHIHPLPPPPSNVLIKQTLEETWLNWRMGGRGGVDDQQGEGGGPKFGFG